MMFDSPFFRYFKKSSFFLLTFLSLSPSAEALFQEPWLGQWMEFEIGGKYGYNFFPQIQGAVPPIASTHHTQILAPELGVTFLEDWDGQVEVEFAKTYTAVGLSVPWGYRSFALQVRKAVLEDIAGDPVSFCVGGLYRNTAQRFIRAFSTPYHSTNNLEIHVSLGKEWSSAGDCDGRCSAVAAFGQGTSGAPWMRAEAIGGLHFLRRHQLYLTLQGYFGLANKQKVPTLNFQGWAPLGHRSLDLKIAYICDFEIYGVLSAQYGYRVYARSYPERAQGFELTYTFPFSFF